MNYGPPEWSEDLGGVIQLLLEGALPDSKGSYGLKILAPDPVLTFPYRGASAFCQAIQSTPQGCELCLSDEEKRLGKIKPGDVLWPTCHGGVETLALALVVREKLFGILFGFQARGVDEATALTRNQELERVLGFQDGKLHALWLALPQRAEESRETLRKRLRGIGEVIEGVLATAEHYRELVVQQDAVTSAFRAMYENLLSIPAGEEGFWRAIERSLDRACMIIGASKASLVTMQMPLRERSRAQLVASANQTIAPGNRTPEISADIWQPILDDRQGKILPYGEGFLGKQLEAAMELQEATVGSAVIVPIMLPERIAAAAIFVIPAAKSTSLSLGRDVPWLEAWGTNVERAYEMSLLQRLRNEWVTKVSHQICSPLNSVAGYARLMLDEWETDKQMFIRVAPNRLQAIRDASQFAANLAQNFAWLGYTDEQKHSASLKLDRHFTAFVIRLARVVQGEARTQGKEIHCVEESLELLDRHIRIDRNFFGQALVNLLDNAVKYSSAGSTVTIFVENSETLQTDRYAHIVIQNCGIRVRKTDCERIFEPRYRTPEAREKSLLSTGIGLTVARDLIELQGGTLNVRPSTQESERGDWLTQFVVRVPYS